MEVSVSILSKKDNLEEAFDLLNNTSCDYIHIDIMDNTFTDTYSFELSELLTINTRKKLDIHIMSTNLDYQIKEAIKLDPEFITFHVESTNDIEKYIKIIKNKNIKVGLAISPETSLDLIKEYENNIDLLLVMSVTPGRGGQDFILETVDKLKKISKDRNYLVSVDGGINDKTIKHVKKYVDIVVSGNYIISSSDIETAIEKLR
ncbi:MAG: ribulose-phosphate 3-epimerase [Bacilli bacterium]|nr:ribulose-phosphate 3-epimerase [Bacilli bacterium]